MTTSIRSLRFACVAALAAAAIAPPAMADAPRYTYVEAGYTSIDQDDPIDSVDGFTLGGSLAVTDTVHLFARYLDGEADFSIAGFSGSLDVQQWAVGAGLNLPVATDTDFVGRLAYVKAEVDGFGASADGDGYALSAGLRTVRGKWDLEGAVVYTDIEDEDDTALDLRAQYLFTPEFSVGPTVSLGDNVGFGVNFRYAFR